MAHPDRQRFIGGLVVVALLGGCGDDGGGSASGTSGPMTTGGPDPTTAGPSTPTTGGTTSDEGSGTGTGTTGGTSTTDGTSTTGGTTTTGEVSASGSSSTDESSSSSSGSTDGPPQDMGTPEPVCVVVDDMDSVDCLDEAPPDSFEPDIQWSFKGPPGFDQCIVTPLVANLTDDDANGTIDLCDVPDVVIIAGPGGGDSVPARLYVLDGETGAVHYYAQEPVQWGGSPALGDIDADGVPEIVALTADGRLAAFEHDGALKWKSAAPVGPGFQSSAVGLADVDEDGDVEIYVSDRLFDHTGALVWTAGESMIYSATTAANLDGQPGLEVLVGDSAFHADGSPWFNGGGSFDWVHPQVANLDADPEPEVLLAFSDRIELRQHTGAMIWSFNPNNTYDLNRPISVHDFDGDGAPEFSASSPQFFGVYEADHSTLWEAMIMDESGQAGGTAFDFLGSGKAQAIYADEENVWVFDDAGGVLMSTSHLSGTILEYPVVADIDNDGSAEILTVSNYGFHPELEVEFTVQAIRDVEDRWVQGRRIWNQHTYHVTNVLEDGTIPTVEKPHWQLLNTFRTQAQIEGNSVCIPQ